MNNNRFLANDGLPTFNYSNFFAAPDSTLRRSYSEGNFHSDTFLNWWNQPQVLYEQRYFNSAVATNLNPQGAVKQNKSKTSATSGSNPRTPVRYNPYSEDFDPNKQPEFTNAVSLNKLHGHKSQCKNYDNCSSDPEDYQKTALRKCVRLRDWLDVPVRFEKNAAFKKSFKFSVMSFNVLAQELLEQHPYLYRTHNHKELKWDVRWKKIYQEILNHQPDIVCLQEVQQSHLSDYFMKPLTLLGYCGIYKKRTGYRCDGCAIFYKVDSVSLLEHETVEFMQPNVPLLNRDNVAIVAVFCPKDLPDNKFVVATTHLLYNPKRQDVRLAQVQILLAEIEKLSFHLDSKKEKNYLPIILTGDFNATPASSLYQLISKGRLKYKHLAARKLDEEGTPAQGPVIIPSDLQITDNCQHALLVHTRDAYYKEYQYDYEKSKHYEDCMMSLSKKVELSKLHHSANKTSSSNYSTVETKSLFSTGTLSHELPFKSAYNHGNPTNPQATTFQNEWVTVDYIFYSGKKKDGQFKDDNLKLCGYFRLPYRSELKGLTIPNTLLGSDHFCLIAKFLLNTES